MWITFVFRTRQTNLCAVFVWRAFNPKKEWNELNDIKEAIKKLDQCKWLGALRFTTMSTVSHIRHARTEFAWNFHLA